MHSQLRKLELFVEETELELLVEEAKIEETEIDDNWSHVVAEMLKLVFYDAENVIEEYKIFTLRNQLLPSSTSSEECGFFSRANPFAYRIRMCLEIRKLIKNLDKIGKYYRFTHVVISEATCYDPHSERGLTHTRASVHYSGVVGRDIDRDTVIETLLKSGNEATLFELPASLVNNQALRTISFSVNGVGPMSTMLVENCIARFMQLRVLDISDSCFDKLPSSVGELKCLRYLDISANGSIKRLSNSINKFLSLQTLRLSHCAQLEGLPKDTGNLISLRHLHITTKQACFPDKAIGCLSSLCSLYIHSCKSLVSLSEGLQHLTSLRTFVIIDCPRLTFFPSTMKHLTALENLLIVDCEELTLLEWQDIEGLRMLRSLEIAFTAHVILERISSKRVFEMALRWNLQGQLDQMQQHLKSAMQESFHDQNQVVDVLSEADKIFDELEIHTLQSQMQPLQRLKLSKVKNFFCSLKVLALRVQIGSRIRSLNSRLVELQIYWTPNLCLLRLSNQHERVLMHRPYPVQSIDVFGRENDREKIVEVLLGLRNESAISVVPVFGIGGIGKTTLEKMVYNDARVMRQLHLRIWVNSSRVFDVNKLVEKVIKSASGNEVTDLRNLNEAELRTMFCKVLLTRTYLLVLDDLWIDNEGQWNELKKLLAGGNGNMILVTTHSESVASIAGTVPPYNLGGLLDDDCLALFLRKASGEGEVVQNNPNLLRIGAEITKKYEGVPLDAVVLGSSLYNETSQCHWEWIRDHHIWDSGHTAISTLSALKISYEKLPCYLKVCLAYSSVFLDSDIEIDKLIQLWMAQGIIHPSTGCHEPEEIGMSISKS
ncbi:hypothetical protein RND71_008572 [Anisodus tanguticus]|uniref:NB-ARC domain-containing protein n=1 Tax=Anisodus tanguticus TaxID=243964 RepID=A0AAE1SPC1_9SOLA|nr:hypothetical protein RND71_008572 [Anisodus tanguticus]